jgi:hypothetical protein
VTVAVATKLTNTATNEQGSSLAAPAPVAMTDEATLTGANAGTAGGTVEYLLYSDANCSELVETLGTKKVAAGVAEPSDPSSAALAGNSTYYWIAKYSGDLNNSPSTTACGDETMTFGTPAALPEPSITTTLAGGGHTGSKITVTEGTAVTDTVTVTAPGGAPVSGRITYAAYTGSDCQGGIISGLGEGGLTTGVGPSTNPLTLPRGTYYFEAFYSGSPELASAATRCGEEVLTVVAPSTPKSTGPTPSPTPPKPTSSFKLLDFRVNTSTGQIRIDGQFFAAGTATVTATIVSGATSAKTKRGCSRRARARTKRCAAKAPTLYGSARMTVKGPGFDSIYIAPARAVFALLRAGHKLRVTLSTTFQNSAGGAPVTHAQQALVQYFKPHGKRRH